MGYSDMTPSNKIQNKLYTLYLPVSKEYSHILIPLVIINNIIIV